MAVLNGPRRRGKCEKLGKLLESEQGWHFWFLPFEVSVKSTFSVEFLAFWLSLDPSPDGFVVLSELQLRTPSLKTGVSL